MDRREFIETQLRTLGWSFTRIEAIICEEPKGFYNRFMRGNWLSHEEILGKCSGDTLILEDDASIKASKESICEAIGEFKKQNGDVLYFYGADRMRRIYGVQHTHAYYLSERTARVIHDLIRAYRINGIERFKPNKLSMTAIDNYFAKHLQKTMNFWGMKDIIIQNRDQFGSETGWGFDGKGIQEHG